jgi:hypothetical protein
MSSVFGFSGAMRRRNPFQPYDDTFDPSLPDGGVPRPDESSASFHATRNALSPPAEDRGSGGWSPPPDRNPFIPADKSAASNFDADFADKSAAANFDPGGQRGSVHAPAPVSDSVARNGADEGQGNAGRSAHAPYPPMGGTRRWIVTDKRGKNWVANEHTSEVAAATAQDEADYGGNEPPPPPSHSSVYEKYGVTPPDLRPTPKEPHWFLPADVPAYRARLEAVHQHNQSEVARAQAELHAAQTGELHEQQAGYFRNQARYGTPYRVKGPDGKDHLKVQNLATGEELDRGEAPEDPRTLQSDKPFIRSVEMVNGKPTVVFRNPTSPGESPVYGGRAAPKEFAPDRNPFSPIMPAYYDKQGNPVFATRDRRSGEVQETTGTEPAGINPARPPKATRKSAGTQLMEQLGIDLGTSGRPGDGAPASAPTGGKTRPDALPRDVFIQRFRVARGRLPTDAEMQRATAQGYVR